MTACRAPACLAHDGASGVEAAPAVQRAGIIDLGAAMLISEAMNRSVVTVAPEESVAAAAALAARSGAEHLLVLDELTLVGILCACDLRGADPGEAVSERMTVPVLTVRPDTPVEEVAATIADCGVGCVPVTLGGLILGTASERDLERCGLPMAHAPRPCHCHPRPGSS